MRQDMLDYAADIVWLLIYSIIAVVFGATVMFVIVFISEMEPFSDYRIIYYDSKGDKTNIYARGYCRGLLGQHNSIVLSPEDISSKRWVFNPERDIEYRCGQLFYKFKSDTLFLYSNEAQTKESINGIPIVNESFETKRKILTVDNCSENGYNYILASPREETGEQNYQ